MKLYKNKEYLEEEYINKRKSIKKIAIEIGCDYATVYTYIKRYNIPTRSLSEAQSTESRKTVALNIWQREGYKENHPCMKSGPEHPCYGRKMSEEQKQKISKNHIEKGLFKGSNNPNYGRKHTPEECKIISIKVTKYFSDPINRKKYSDVATKRFADPLERKKISDSRIGLIISEESKKHISEGLIKYYTEHTSACKGIPLSEEHKIRLHIVLTKIYENPDIRKKCGSPGKLNPRWLGGISFFPYCKEWKPEIKEKTRNTYKRTCFVCGKTEEENGRKLDVHHIDYNKMQGCKSKKWRLLPLCRSCHTKTNFNRHYWFNLLYNYWVLNPNIQLSGDFIVGLMY